MCLILSLNESLWHIGVVDDNVCLMFVSHPISKWKSLTLWFEKINYFSLLVSHPISKWKSLTLTENQKQMNKLVCLILSLNESLWHTLQYKMVRLYLLCLILSLNESLWHTDSFSLSFIRQTCLILSLNESLWHPLVFLCQRILKNVSHPISKWKSLTQMIILFTKWGNCVSHPISKWKSLTQFLRLTHIRYF